MKDKKIKVTDNSMVYFDDKVLGIDGENLQGKIIFYFENFKNGVAWLEFEKENGTKKYIPMNKVNETYEVEIKPSLLSDTSIIYLQLRITEDENENGIPVFKSNKFYMNILSSINATSTIEDDYPNILDVLNNKQDKLKAGKNITIENNTINANVEGTVDKEYIDNQDKTVLENAKVYSDSQIPNVVKTYVNEHKEELKGEQGADGKNGIDGLDGVSPTVNVTQTQSGATITITDKEGTTTTEIKNGVNGKDGVNGQDGTDGKTPVKEVDYFTNEDKQEIESEITAKLESQNYVKDNNYVHTDNNYTNEEKTKLSELNNYDDTDIKNLIKNKQDKLISGENIKTINGESLLGSGNINVAGGSSAGGGTKIIKKYIKYKITQEDIDNFESGDILTFDIDDARLPEKVYIFIVNTASETVAISNATLLLPYIDTLYRSINIISSNISLAQWRTTSALLEKKVVHPYANHSFAYSQYNGNLYNLAWISSDIKDKLRLSLKISSLTIGLCVYMEAIYYED